MRCTHDSRTRFAADKPTTGWALLFSPDYSRGGAMRLWMGLVAVLVGSGGETIGARGGRWGLGLIVTDWGALK